MGPEIPGLPPEDLPPEESWDDDKSGWNELSPKEQEELMRFRIVESRFAREVRDLTQYCRQVDPALDDDIDKVIEHQDEEMETASGYAEAHEILARHFDEIRKFRDRVISSHPETPYPWNLVQPGAEADSHAFREALEVLEHDLENMEYELQEASPPRTIEPVQRFRDSIEAALLVAGKDPKKRLSAVDELTRELPTLRAKLFPKPGNSPQGGV